MKLTMATFVLFGNLAISSAPAFEDPSHFRGVPWGASETELREKLSGVSEGPQGRLNGIRRCESYQEKFLWVGDRSCDGAFYIGSVSTQAIYSFREDRFTNVLLRFAPENFSEIERVFLERYGPPTSQADLPIKTRGGAELMNRTLKWTGPVVVVWLQRYLGKVTESGASLSTVEDNQEAARLRGKDVNDAAKGL
jgi:hypothetical protein